MTIFAEPFTFHGNQSPDFHDSHKNREIWTVREPVSSTKILTQNSRSSERLQNQSYLRRMSGSGITPHLLLHSYKSSTICRTFSPVQSFRTVFGVGIGNKPPALPFFPHSFQIGFAGRRRNQQEETLSLIHI